VTPSAAPLPTAPLDISPLLGWWTCEGLHDVRMHLVQLIGVRLEDGNLDKCLGLQLRCCGCRVITVAGSQLLAQHASTKDRYEDEFTPLVDVRDVSSQTGLQPLTETDVHAVRAQKDVRIHHSTTEVQAQGHEHLYSPHH